MSPTMERTVKGNTHEYLRQEVQALRLKVHELEERIHDMLDPLVETPVLGASARAGEVKPEHWFYEPAELAEVLTRMAKAHPDADRVVFKLGDEYFLAKHVAYVENESGEPDWCDPAVVVSLR